MKRIAIIALLALAATAATKARKNVAVDAKLPALGTKFHTLPAGAGKNLAEASCLPCHSADMIVQQRLTEKQWTAEVEKMTRWGATVRDDDKAALIAYLAKHFGTENKSFAPLKARPVGY